MRSSVRRKVPAAYLLLAAAGFWALAARGSAQELGRPILRPTTITEPGVYTVFRSISSQTANPAITIRSNHVTLNLNGHSLNGPGNRTGVGILVENSNGVCVRNGVVTGFGTNVRVAGSDNVRIEDLKIIGNDLGGSPPDIETGVMVVNSRAVLVQDNVISRTFLGIFVRGGGSGGNRIAGNTLTGGMNGMLGICYNPVPGSDAAPQGDLVYANLVSRFMVGIATSDRTRNNVFKENVIAYLSMPIQESTDGSNVFVDNTTTQIEP